MFTCKISASDSSFPSILLELELKPQNDILKTRAETKTSARVEHDVQEQMLGEDEFFCKHLLAGSEL